MEETIREQKLCDFVAIFLATKSQRRKQQAFTHLIELQSKCLNKKTAPKQFFHPLLYTRTLPPF